MRSKFLLCFVLLIAGFLTGFNPQYARLQRLHQELSAATKQFGSCQSGEQLSQLRDTATISGGGAKELREGGGARERVF
jgi:hypothetical protein